MLLPVSYKKYSLRTNNLSTFGYIQNTIDYFKFRSSFSYVMEIVSKEKEKIILETFSSFHC